MMNGDSMDFQRWDAEKSGNNRLPVGVAVHNARSPFLSVIDQPDGSLQGLSGFVDDAVSNLETTGDTLMNKHLGTNIGAMVLQKCLSHMD